jgi:hypothetical protein
MWGQELCPQRRGTPCPEQPGQPDGASRGPGPRLAAHGGLKTCVETSCVPHLWPSLWKSSPGDPGPADMDKPQRDPGVLTLTRLVLSSSVREWAQ